MSKNLGSKTWRSVDMNQRLYLPASVRHLLRWRTAGTYQRKMFKLDPENKVSRVEVSKDFRADHLWCKLSALTSAVSFLIRCCILPENLWTALIHLWSVPKTQFSKAATSALSSVDFLGFRMTFSVQLSFFF